MLWIEAKEKASQRSAQPFTWASLLSLPWSVWGIEMDWKWRRCLIKEGFETDYPPSRFPSQYPTKNFIGSLHNAHRKISSRPFTTYTT